MSRNKSKYPLKILPWKKTTNRLYFCYYINFRISWNTCSDIIRLTSFFSLKVLKLIKKQQRQQITFHEWNGQYRTFGFLYQMCQGSRKTVLCTFLEAMSATGQTKVIFLERLVLLSVNKIGCHNFSISR
jgi:hypothetical protein